MAENTLEPLSPFTDAHTLELADEVEVEVPRGEPRQLLAAVAAALAAREPAETLAEKLTEAAGAVLPEEAQADERLAQAVAYRLALPYLARHEAVKGALAEVEPLLEDLTEEELDERGPRSPAQPCPRLRWTSSC